MSDRDSSDDRRRKSSRSPRAKVYPITKERRPSWTDTSSDEEPKLVPNITAAEKETIKKRLPREKSQESDTDESKIATVESSNKTADPEIFFSLKVPKLTYTLDPEKPENVEHSPSCDVKIDDIFGSEPAAILTLDVDTGGSDSFSPLVYAPLLETDACIPSEIDHQRSESGSPSVIVSVLDDSSIVMAGNETVTGIMATNPGIPIDASVAHAHDRSSGGSSPLVIPLLDVGSPLVYDDCKSGNRTPPFIVPVLNLNPTCPHNTQTTAIDVSIREVTTGFIIPSMKDVPMPGSKEPHVEQISEISETPSPLSSPSIEVAPPIPASGEGGAERLPPERPIKTRCERDTTESDETEQEEILAEEMPQESVGEQIAEEASNNQVRKNKWFTGRRIFYCAGVAVLVATVFWGIRDASQKFKLESQIDLNDEILKKLG